MAYNQISFGSRGSDVAELQKRLNQEGYSLAVDGEFGKETNKAVKDYQKRNGLVVDGIVGQNTWASLLKSPAATPGDSTGKEVLSGVSDETYDLLAQLEKGYDPSDEVDAAAALRDSIQQLKPDAYVPGFQEELEQLYQRMLAGEKFSYDPEQDAAYRNYARLYQRGGQAAMADTLGQAAALTGGYDSTYAQTAAQQSYNAYMQQLTALLPELEAQALQRKKADDQALVQQYETLLQRQQAEQLAWEAVYEQWLEEMESAEAGYQDAYKRDYDAYKLMLDYFADKADKEQKASGGATVNSGKTEPANKAQESLSSRAAESLERAVSNYIKAGQNDAALALAQQYAPRMTPAQKKRFTALLEIGGLTWDT